jgi:hypothetical protein
VLEGLEQLPQRRDDRVEGRPLALVRLPARGRERHKRRRRAGRERWAFGFVFCFFGGEVLFVCLFGWLLLFAV